MQRKNVFVLIFIGVIFLAVATFFIIKLAGNTAVVYEDHPTPDMTYSDSMNEIEEQVSQLRGLDIEESIPRRLMPTDELRQVILNNFLEDYNAKDEERDIAVMNLFGLLPADFKLRDFYQDLYAEQIAGYYDSEEKEMIVISDSGFGGVERSTYAHEFVHTLQYEHFDFNGTLGYTDDASKEDSEGCMALQALIEGDAVLTEQLWFQEFGTQEDMQDLQDFATTYESPVYDSAPDSLKESLTFPYLYGSQFVQTLYAQGGYKAIDAAFSTTNPVSSEQILHPARFPSDVPSNPILPNLQTALGQAWVEIEKDTLGEWYVYLVLAKAYDPQFRLFDSVALDAAEGWGGDAFSILKNNETGELAAITAFNWDTTADADAAVKAFSTYSDLRFGSALPNRYWQGEDYFCAFAQTSPKSFVWVLAEDLSTMQSLLASVGD